MDRMDLKRYWLPLAQRFVPTPGPGGISGFALSLFLHSDARNMVHVTRHLDVMEVWERDDDFSVRTYDQRMTETTGRFYLGIDDLDDYTADASVIRRAVLREDEALVRRLIAEETERAMETIRGRGKVDVVRDLANVVPIRFAARYFGLTGVDPDELRHLFQVASWYVFSFWSDPGMREAGRKAGGRLREILANIIARRRREGDVGSGDVMGRFLAMTDGFKDGDAGIARSIAGLSSGTLNAPMGLFVTSVDKLMSLPRAELQHVQDVARAAVRGSDADVARLRAVVHEAERFGVFPSVLYRYAENDAVIARGTDREKHVKKGTTVVIWPTLAAFDPDVFERPFDFVPGRPKWQYMGFGHGRHRCLGEHIGQALLEEMCRSLFTLPNLRRAPGKAGKVRNLPVEQASFPDSFTLEFDRVA